jgi:hypothetical protein
VWLNCGMARSLLVTGSWGHARAHDAALCSATPRARLPTPQNGAYTRWNILCTITRTQRQGIAVAGSKPSVASWPRPCKLCYLAR